MDKFPIWYIMHRAATVKSGQAPVHRYVRPLYERIRNGEVDPTFIISDEMPLQDAPIGYGVFKSKKDERTKVGLKP